LPQGLLWPNPEVSVLVVFATGLVESSTAILGALAVGYDIEALYSTLAVGVLLLVALLLVQQIQKLRFFYKKECSDCWVPSPRPSSRDEVDDPLLGLLCKMHLSRPRCREQGEFVLPDDQATEPSRTENALAEAFHCGLGTCFKRVARWLTCRRSSYSYHKREHTVSSLEKLQGWVGDGSASKAGATFTVAIILVSLALAVSTGFLLLHPKASTPNWQIVRNSLQAVVQIFVGLFLAGPAANDVWNGVSVAMVFLLEGLASLCLVGSAAVMLDLPSADTNASLANASIANASANTSFADLVDSSAVAADAAKLQRVDVALRWAELSATLLFTALFVPLLLMFYDGVLVPVIVHVRSTEASSTRETVCAVLVAMVVLPLQFAKSLLGIDADATDLVNEYADDAQELGQRRQSVDEEEEGEDEAEGSEAWPNADAEPSEAWVVEAEPSVACGQEAVAHEPSHR